MKLREFLERLSFEGKLMHMKDRVTADYEIASFVYGMRERPIMFHNVDEYRYRVLFGICSTRGLISDALNIRKDELLPTLLRAIENPKEPEVIHKGAVQEVVEEDVDLQLLPIPKYFESDGGPYITAGIAVIRDPDTGRNVSFHRLMRIGKKRFVARIVEGRQTWTTYKKLVEKNGELEMAVCIGNSTAVLLAGACSPPSGVDELSIANALDETPLVRCRTKDLEVPADSEIVFEGRLIDEESDEGPFVDLTETLDFPRKQPIFEVDLITHRKDPIFQALLPGGREHRLLMGMPREPTIFKEVKKVCDCRNVALTQGGCSWLHAVIQISKKGEDDGKRAIEAAFKGHTSLKHCVVVDTDVDPWNPEEVEWAIATRFQGDVDIIIFKDQPSSSLDPSAQQKVGEKARGTKVGLDATIPWGADKKRFRKVRYKEFRREE